MMILLYCRISILDACDVWEKRCWKRKMMMQEVNG
jgi:hypothetical protein